MSGFAELFTFAGVMVLGQFSPGPDMILLTRTALKSGARAGVQMAMGIGCGLAIHATLAVAGLALALDRLPILRRALAGLAAGYLVWLAWRIVREISVRRHATGGLEMVGQAPLDRPFLRGFLCNLLNPKVAILLMAVSAPFLKGERPDGWALAIWGIIVGQGWILWSLWACALQWPPLRRGYERAGSWIDGVFALVLLILAVCLILD